MKQKLITILVACCFCIALFDVSAVSAETYGILTYTVTDGVAKITDCDTSVSGTFHIPASINNHPVTTISYGAFMGCSQLTGIVIPNGVTLIGAEAFADCTALQEISIPDSVISVGNYAFDNTAYYNDSDNWETPALYVGDVLLFVSRGYSGTFQPKTGTRVIAGSAFAYNNRLANIVIPEGVTHIGTSTFRNCTALQSVTFPKSLVKIGQDSFTNCTKLQTLYYYGTQAEWEALNDADVAGAQVVCVKHTNTAISQDQKTYTVTPVNIDEGTAVILALYRGGIFQEVQAKPYEGEPVIFTTNETGVTAKVMAWQSLGDLKAVSQVEFLQ